MKITPVCLLLLMYTLAKSQTEIPLYSGAIPNAKKVADNEWTEKTDNGITVIHNITIPTLTIYEAPKAKATGTGVIICPGGGYGVVAIAHEGFDVAKQFNAMGVTAFVLKYRLPTDSTMENKEIGPLQDAQRAIQFVRDNAKKYHLKKDKIGIMGFSAGGHLASTAATHFATSQIPNKKHTDLRPDFAILIYPVISFTDSLMHQGSRDNLIGKNPSQEKITLYSNELQVNDKTPPTFLVHAKDDGGVKVQNSIAYRDALQKSGVQTEMYLFEKGGHGFGLNNPTSDVKWMDHVQQWMKKMSLLK